MKLGLLACVLSIGHAVQQGDSIVDAARPSLFRRWMLVLGALMVVGCGSSPSPVAPVPVAPPHATHQLTITLSPSCSLPLGALGVISPFTVSVNEPTAGVEVFTLVEDAH
jgi:hypothetical protein